MHYNEGQPNLSNVLIVDDRVENLQAADEILATLENVNLVHAQSGEEALEKALKQRFAVVLLDVNMPGMDGYEVARLMSNNPHTKYLPIVMITALGQSNEEALKAYAAGAVDYLIKPIQPEILVNKIKQFVELYFANESVNQSLIEISNLKEDRDIILNAAGEGIIEIDDQGYLHFANKKALELLNCDHDTALRNHFDHWFSFKSKPNYFTILKKSLKEVGTDLRCRLNALTEDGNSVPIEAICTSTHNTTTSSVGIIMIFQDITDRTNMENRLLHLANYDHLTGLTNRAYFQENLSRAIARSKRFNTTAVLLMIDLDRFKQINDTLGHDVGDALLQAVANRLQTCVRSSDVITRLGGDEFAVIAEDLTNPEQEGRSLADKMVTELAKPYDIKIGSQGIKQLVVECSIGMSFSQNGSMDATTIYKSADIALYEAKNAGRNTYKLFAKKMSESTKQHASIENKLRKAIEHDHLTLHFQPQVSLSLKRVTGFESLLRWIPKSPSHTPISPAVFIPIAEQSRLIHKLGDFVLHQACKQLEIWQHSLAKQDITLSVNLSAKQLNVPNFIEVIDRITQQYQFNNNDLVFEITETAVLEHGDYSIATLEKIKQRGFGLALDDFGTGYSSLSYLQKLPVDYLKIDRCFIQKMNQDPKNFALVEAIMAIASTFSLDVIAEGVEEYAELKSLTTLHCDKIQGYYFSRPIPAADTEKIIITIEEYFQQNPLATISPSQSTQSLTSKH
ncbi:MAG: hypothetical protein COB04_15220 [Gammaproteobacteria bacterium]|nr:MAG: hypothetical protein COB04_15220 [Gammaproteobacteria bacterium]